MCVYRTRLFTQSITSEIFIRIFCGVLLGWVCSCQICKSRINQILPQISRSNTLATVQCLNQCNTSINSAQ